jgi:hypothetical protein
MSVEAFMGFGFCPPGPLVETIFPGVVDNDTPPSLYCAAWLNHAHPQKNSVASDFETPGLLK